MFSETQYLSLFDLYKKVSKAILKITFSQIKLKSRVSGKYYIIDQIRTVKSNNFFIYEYIYFSRTNIPTNTTVHNYHT